MIKRLLVILCLCSSARATTTITGNLKNLGTGSISLGTFVRFYLRGCSGNQPRINGTALIAPTLGNVYFFDFVPSPAGVISGTIYSTTDVTGTGSGEIECGGVKTGLWYGMVPFLNGKSGPETPIAAKNTASLDISNVTPITTQPVVTSPTGDTTYARLDAGNTPFTGAVTGPSFGGVLYVGPGGYSTLSACYTALPANGGTCMVEPNYSETLSAAITLKNNSGFQFTGPAAITCTTNDPGCFNVPDGVIGAFIRGPMPYSGLTAFGGTGLIFTYSGSTGSCRAIQIGTSAGSSQAGKIGFQNFLVDARGAGSSCVLVDTYGLNQVDWSGIAVAGASASANNGANTQITLRMNINAGGDGEEGTIQTSDFSGGNIGVQLNSVCCKTFKDVAVAAATGFPGTTAWDLNGAAAITNIGGAGSSNTYATGVLFRGGAAGNYFVTGLESSTNGANFSGSTAVNNTAINTHGGNFHAAADTGGAGNFYGAVGTGGMFKIGDTTLAAPAANITFSSIPGTYRHLRIEFQGRASDAATVVNVGVQFNADTGTNYDAEVLSANNVTAAAGSSVTQVDCLMAIVPGANATNANAAGSATMEIQNYAGTTFEKQIISTGGTIDRSVSANNWAFSKACDWRNTAAITSIKLFSDTGGNLSTGTRATLYGIN